MMCNATKAKFKEKTAMTLKLQMSNLIVNKVAKPSLRVKKLEQISMEYISILTNWWVGKKLKTIKNYELNQLHAKLLNLLMGWLRSQTRD